LLAELPNTVHSYIWPCRVTARPTSGMAREC